MKYVKSPAVYSCCGRYYATTKDTAESKVICQSCKKELIAPVQVPRITVVTK